MSIQKLSAKDIRFYRSNIQAFFFDLTGKSPSQDQLVLLQDWVGLDALRFNVLGGRFSGKSMTACVIAAYEAVLNERNVLLLSPTRYNKPIYSYLKKFFSRHPALRKLLRNPGRTHLMPELGVELKNGVSIIPISEGSAFAGIHSAVLIVDEAARISRDTLNDARLCNAESPSKELLISSRKTGKYATFAMEREKSRKRKEPVYSWNSENNPGITKKTLKKLKEDLSPDEYALEVQASEKFVGHTKYFPLVSQLIISKDRWLEGEQESARQIHIDWGRRVHSTCAVVSEKTPKGKIKFLWAKEWRPRKGHPVDYDEVMRDIDDIVKKYGIWRITADSEDVDGIERLQKIYGKDKVEPVVFREKKRNMCLIFRRKVIQRMVEIPDYYYSFPDFRECVWQLLHYRGPDAPQQRDDFVDSAIQSVCDEEIIYRRFKPLYEEERNDWLEVLKAGVKVSRSLSSHQSAPRPAGYKPLRGIAREQRPIDPDSPESIFIKALRRKKKELVESA